MAVPVRTFNLAIGDWQHVLFALSILTEEFDARRVTDEPAASIVVGPHGDGRTVFRMPPCALRRALWHWHDRHRPRSGFAIGVRFRTIRGREGREHRFIDHRSRSQAWPR